MQLTFLSEAPPASRSVSLGLERDWLTLAATSCSHLALWLRSISRAGWSGKTSPESCHLTEDGILAPSSGCWQNSGMGSPTVFLTLNTSEWAASPALSRNGGGVCSLSDILETGDVPQRYYLTAKACQGILRRAAKRGKTLFPQLAHALQAVADSGPISTSMED